MSKGVSVLGGKCPGGKCPGGKCPGGMCPWGKCPGGTCPGGLCPRTFSAITYILCNHYLISNPTTIPYCSLTNWRGYLSRGIHAICTICVAWEGSSLTRGYWSGAYVLTSSGGGGGSSFICRLGLGSYIFGILHGSTFNMNWINTYF